MLNATDKLTTHFTAREAGVDAVTLSDSIVENARGVARWLETMRAIVNEDVPPGAPERRVVITSWYRPPALNTEVGGSATSDHPEGLAADFHVTGLSPYDLYVRLRGAQAKNRLPLFDQLIWYAVDNHIHVGLGPRMRQQILFKTSEGSYVQLAGEVVKRIRGFV